MNILAQFEHLVKQAVFSSNKDIVLQSAGLSTLLKNSNNQQIRVTISNNSEQFADMSRVVRQ
ncbi:TPA: hypothetical protein RG395_002389 [Legionella pneumophila]|uniref:Uncharacterized protein n=1 Tax=Legionella pneumophila TaxID=446 RepID=A0AAN5P418_LEGPN|nr:hypothetical protein [Legionella pneumophila]MDW8878724.1 hypothetical protein [Legionella pneumophila subsp. fraseri]MDW8962962.1 hypothetical protein [Legionella pneumophila subsp. fraseri]MDW9035448.1 hypothetical protein [Legionella pneumophila subsp. fraseri]MDW9038509.1 hypothetical protein [Legionella pneumophila subsp. fraseri]MDW9041570.1 hypothetical protein [Legionella pneumophila subsp. fraseri]